MATQAANCLINIFDSEHDATYSQGIGRCVFRLGFNRWRMVELRQLNSPVSIRSPQCGNVGTDIFESDGAVDPRPFDRGFAFQLHAELEEKRFDSLDVFDNDKNVVHSFNTHTN